MSIRVRLSSRFLFAALLGFVVAALPASAERAQVTVLVTTDLHGRILPHDYGADRPAELGLAKLSTLVQQVRRDAPQALLIDCGDTIQGTPLAYYFNRKDNAPVHPMMAAMNALGYVSMTPGNHEYNFGLDVLRKAQGEAKFPWISANTYRTGTDEPAFPPYVIKEVSGVRVGILGLTTPSIPNWENPENYAGLEFRPLVSEAQKWVKHLREQEKVDAVIVAAHCGVEENLATGRITPGDFAGENAALALARAVPGIDVLFLGHTHRDIPALVVNGVLIAQAGRWGDRLVRTDLTFDRADAGARWTVYAKSAQTLPVTAAVAADPAIVALAEPYHRATQEWLNRVVGRSEKALEAGRAHLQDSAVLDLIHRVQLDALGADVSFTANLNPRARIPAGDVTVRDVANLYIYENTLYCIEATGAQVKAALEHAARYFKPHEEGKAPADLVDRTIPLYNFDIAEGVSYEIDIRRPVGDRVVNLTFQGAPLAPDRVLKVALNNYRYNGGGGYTMFKGAKILARPSAEIRDLIIDWVERHGTIPTEPTHNWKLLP